MIGSKVITEIMSKISLGEQLIGLKMTTEISIGKIIEYIPHK